MEIKYKVLMTCLIMVFSGFAGCTANDENISDDIVDDTASDNTNQTNNQTQKLPELILADLNAPKYQKFGL